MIRRILHKLFEPRFRYVFIDGRFIVQYSNLLYFWNYFQSCSTESNAKSVIDKELKNYREYTAASWTYYP